MGKTTFLKMYLVELTIFYATSNISSNFIEEKTKLLMKLLREQIDLPLASSEMSWR